MVIIPQDADGKNHRQRILSQAKMHETAIDKTAITALILAGGAGRRFGGADKGLLRYNGTTLIEAVLARIAPQANSVLLSCNRNTEVYSALAPTIGNDLRGNFQGPLAGIEVASAHVHTEFVMVCPCDTPWLPDDLAQQLTGAFLKQPTLEISHARSDGQEHFLCAVLRTRCLASLPDYLDSGQRRVRDWFAQHNVTSVDFPNTQRAFANINQLTDIEPGLLP